MKKIEKIEAYLTKTMPLEELVAFKEAMQIDEGLKNLVRQRGLTYLVLEETAKAALERKRKEKQHLAKLREGTEQGIKTLKRTRIMTLLAIAASVMVLVFVGNYFLVNENTNELVAENWENTDFNTKSFSTTATIEPKHIIGKWQTTIKAQDGTGILIQLEYKKANSFSLVVAFFKNFTLVTKDQVKATGIYSLNGEKIRMNLNEKSIDRQPSNSNTVSQLHTGAMEQWLKKETNRLFKEQIKIVQLNNQKLLMQYDGLDGLDWEKI